MQALNYDKTKNVLRKNFFTSLPEIFFLILLLVGICWVAFDGFGIEKKVELITINANSGYAYHVHLEHSMWAENYGNLKARVLENNEEIGPRISYHDNIRKHGSGRFSFWDKALFFSSSDNTDPRTNGRTYYAIGPAPFPTTVYFALFLVSILFLFLKNYFSRTSQKSNDLDFGKNVRNTLYITIVYLLLALILFVNPGGLQLQLSSLGILLLLVYFSLTIYSKYNRLLLVFNILIWTLSVFASKYLTGLSDGQILLGLFPMSDGFAYFQGGLGLIRGEPISALATHRPLVTLMVGLIQFITGQSILLYILTISVLFSLAFSFCIYEIFNSFKLPITLVFCVVTGAFSIRWIGTTWFEIPGLTLGLTSLLFTIKYIRTLSISHSAFAMFFLSLSMVVRPGPLLIIPALFISFLLLAMKHYKTNLRSLVILFFVLSISSATPFLLNKVTSNLNPFKGSISFGNYSLVIYGLIHGTHWSDFQSQPENHGLSGNELYRRAFDESVNTIQNDPSRILDGLTRSFKIGFDPNNSDSIFGFISIHFVRIFLMILMFASVAISLFKILKMSPLNILCLALFTGFLLSALLLPFWDLDGMRVYASAIPFLAFFSIAPIFCIASSTFIPETSSHKLQWSSSYNIPSFSFLGFLLLIAIFSIHSHLASKSNFYNPNSAKPIFLKSVVNSLDKKYFSPFMGTDLAQNAKNSLVIGQYPETQEFLRKVVNPDLIVLPSPYSTHLIILIDKSDLYQETLKVNSITLDNMNFYLTDQILHLVDSIEPSH